MEVQFLWIDSLCIIQDDPGDWATESAKMSGLYRNALFTISADVAQDVHAGFLRQHNLVEEAVSVCCIGPSGGSALLSVRDSSEFCMSGSKRANTYYSSKFPLTRRAWTLQERMLSARLLHFNGREMSWECKEASRCECQGPVVTEKLARASNRTFGDVYSEWDLEKFNEVWHSVVEEYSERQLTFATHKLPAISGIARRAQHLLRHLDLDDTYLAGLWKATLPYDLAWRNPHSFAKRPATYIAPSWSWAAIEGSVSFWGGRPLLEILDAKCDLAPMVEPKCDNLTDSAGSDPTGKVVDGS
ncbi:hypothetical protein H2201_007398 [Coniosporium apollinis]|uniref:Heterokaryon incompatibility domain-containing protein n=1 Tax=Coniosporium apollinis TaxID=61459 RepID=A0ABQ9NJF5_9PEZI|nr:hypothetical protein H2201_007398 [Coniosporium apollinis]